eukprot:TRINITY_DN16774_c0_g1_i2.p1 TRINITY_DN16774_c0_g1~~TRINITY_DN16774_c0_g1_i2.p1  ORF type:complete len:845 (+),score=265.76 TRINITY_DN16774_c0_g1_i2:157-2535(+)
MIIVPPRHYCIVQNPVVIVDGKVEKDRHGNIKVRFGDKEIREATEPFPLYPNEELVPIPPENKLIAQLQVIPPLKALVIQILRDYKIEETIDGKTVVKAFTAGDSRLFKGPGTYKPRIEEKIVKEIDAYVIGAGEALHLRAKNKFTDRNGVERKAGEEWLWRDTGSFIPDVDEDVVQKITAEVLTDQTAIHLRAKRTFEDKLKKTTRKAGEEWLVTSEDSSLYIPDVHESIVKRVNKITLTSRQYCIVLDPVDPDTGKQHFGRKDLRKGERSFFLHPGENLEKGIQDVEVLAFNEALLLRAKEEFTDSENKEKHEPGDLWLIKGPRDYIPPIEVEIVKRREAIPLDENEGIYVRNIKTGKVTVVSGTSHLLEANEVLWEKQLTPVVEELLAKAENRKDARDPTRLVTYRAPHNSAVQIYDFKEKKSRVVFGPKLVTLGPDEHFTVLSLSGDKPKRPHVIKDLKLLMGPDFMTDFVIVETADHAKLKLKLSYNWHFNVDTSSEETSAKIFQVPDFVGDACKAIASSVRAVVAMHTFDDFHKKSARIIREAVFGKDEKGKIKDEYEFEANGLVITNIDIQSVEPVDSRTRDSLQKSVQLAIEITTKSQEARARHEAERAGQEARGKLERQKLEDEAKAEEARKELIQLEAESAIVESTGQALAEAQAKAKVEEIQAKTAVTLAELEASARAITSKAELETLEKKNAADLLYQTKIDELELTRAEKMAEIESEKFKKIVSAIGPDTIKAISRAGSEMRAKLLKGLGLKSFMITDGKSPINLFNTANGLVASAPKP